MSIFTQFLPQLEDLRLQLEGSVGSPTWSADDGALQNSILGRPRMGYEPRVSKKKQGNKPAKVAVLEMK